MDDDEINESTHAKEKRDDIYSVEVTIPIFPNGFQPKQEKYEYDYQKKLDLNLKYFLENRSRIIEKHDLLDTWFGFWMEDENEKVVTGFSDKCVISSCPFHAVITYGIKVKVNKVFVQKSSGDFF